MENQEYLGDGVYAEWDGYGVWIYTSNGIENSDRIYIEQETLQSLNAFFDNKLDEE